MAIHIALRLPYPRYLWTIAARTALMWLLLRLLAVAVLWLAAGAELSASAAAPSLGLPALLVHLDRRRGHELLLHATFGAVEHWMWSSSAIVALALDALAFVALS